MKKHHPKAISSKATINSTTGIRTKTVKFTLENQSKEKTGLIFDGKTYKEELSKARFGKVQFLTEDQAILYPIRTRTNQERRQGKLPRGAKAKLDQ